MPKSIEISVTDLVGKTKLLPISQERMLEENEETVYKLNSVSEAISEISKSYKANTATAVKSSVKVDKFVDYALIKIDERNILYDDLEDTENGILEEIYDILQEKQEVHAQDIIEVFNKHNSYIVGQEDDVMEVVKVVNEYGKHEYVSTRQETSKNDNISRGLEGVSKVISGIAASIENGQENKFDNQKEKIETLLLQKGIGVYDIGIKQQKNGKMQVTLFVNQKDDVIDEVSRIQKIEEILSKVFDEKMAFQNKKEDILEFAGEDKFKITVAINGIQKDGSEISGDSSLRLKLNDGKLLLALSDGMGSGKEANKISASVIKMIKKLMSAGFEKEAATELINNSIAMKAQNESFATLDMSIFDLYAGNIEVLKNYACPTYIKRGKNVQAIQAISLPTGILNNIDSVVFDTNIQKDDIIVMCTDGIIDANKEAVNKEESFKEFLKAMKTDNVKKMADIILQEAIDQDYGKPKDDMSVIVAKIG